MSKASRSPEGKTSPGKTSPPPVPVEERLFSLVLALLATDIGLTKNEILSTVQGYRQRYSPRGDNANLERQFERDKDDVRDLGVPLETVEPTDEPGNNQNLRYRIPREGYELPADISFSPEETAMLGLAAMVWREGSLSAESRRALLKLKSLGGAVEEPVIGYATRLRARDAAFEPIRTALDRGQSVRFSYLKPGETEARVRNVMPLALVQHQGRWLLSAEDVESRIRKTFLLQRIVSPVQARAGYAVEGTEDPSVEALRELEQIWQSHRAVVTARPDSDAATRLLKRRGTVKATDGTLELHYSDLDLLADELTGYGPEVQVVSPADLREAVVARLEEVLRAHEADGASPVTRAADRPAVDVAADEGSDARG